MILLALVPVLIWAYLVFGHAGFWRVSKHLPNRFAHGSEGVRVVAVIPARDEAGTIAETVLSLRNQTLAPEAVIVVDDNSADGTGEIARSAGALVVPGKPLMPGWTGKMWALSQGVAEAERLHPDFLLFTDADITHEADSIATLAGIAESGKYALASFMVRLHCQTGPERLLIPAFVFFFFLIYPPGRTPGAAGGCVLVRPDALREAGGIEAIRGAVIDDCALAKKIHSAGGRLWLGLTNTAHSTRVYGSLGEVGAMISRTAFNQLRHSALLLIGTLTGLFVAYLLPFVLLASRDAAMVCAGAIAVSLMTACYCPMVRFYKQPFWMATTLPLAAIFYAGATVHSAVQYWSGRGGRWKGRVQDGRA